GDKRLGPGIPSICVKNLTFTYPGREEPTLRDACFSIDAGEKVALVGPDGSGETTLLRLLCGLYKITLGDIYYDGVSIKSLARGELKNKISALFEDFVRYNMSLRKSIVISDSKRDFDRKLYNKVLRVALLDRWIAREGITDSQILGRVQKGGMEISAAHWQRIALARCLYRNRSVFFMDEPLSLVDNVKRKRILRNILDFVGERTLVVTLHGLEEVNMFDRLFRVSSGRISEISLSKD
ncbi:MAG: ABC transporter ATP-binding protein, partial [Patescibacteria group bacterium]|nr:ABC transporter ATP-binding protein [Patescibacteria group bacterium]